MLQKRSVNRETEFCLIVFKSPKTAAWRTVYYVLMIGSLPLLCLLRFEKVPSRFYKGKFLISLTKPKKIPPFGRDNLQKSAPSAPKMPRFPKNKRGACGAPKVPSRSRKCLADRWTTGQEKKTIHQLYFEIRCKTRHAFVLTN